MTSPPRPRALLAVLALLGCLALAGCGLSAGSAVPGRAGPGSIQPVPELKDVPITVGSKDFSDNINIAYLMIYSLQAAGMDVRDLTKIQGSNSARTALKTGQIDLYPDYTGTAWLNYDQHDTPIVDTQEMLRAVAAEDARQGISWIDMAPANNTYALAVGPGTEQRYGFRSLSDMAAFAQANPAQATVCMGTEFASRVDGWQGVSQHYGMKLPPDNVKLMSDATVFPAMAAGNPCLFGVLSTTDGRIAALKLTVLADDRTFFPKYNVAGCIRSELLARYPKIADVLRPVMDRVTEDTMIKLNAQADVTGRDWSAIALEWLTAQGFVTDAGRS